MVTGGLGFTGRHITKRLAAGGTAVEQVHGIAHHCLAMQRSTFAHPRHIHSGATCLRYSSCTATKLAVRVP
jgi:nucleoside-diphosphate-sugar epimerase